MQMRAKRPRSVVAFVLLAGLLAVGFGSAAADAAEEPEILAELSAGQIYLGESVNYQVTLNHVENPPEPDLSGLKDFDVQPRRPQNINSRHITIINGQRSEIVRYGRVFPYQLTPRRAGVLAVPGPTATVAGRELRGPDLSLRVIAPERQDLVRMTITTSPAAVYPTQPLTVTLSVAVKALPGELADRNPLSVQPRSPALRIPWVADQQLPDGLSPAAPDMQWLNRFRDPEGNGFIINNYAERSVFSLYDERAATFQPRPRRVEQRDDQGDRVEYWVYDFSRQFTADKAGRYTFGPVTLKGQFASGVSASGLEGRNVYAIAQPLVVEVRQVPEADRPENYLGAIGRFRWSASLDPREAKVGDPLTLVLTLEGEGSLAAVTPPELARIPEIAENYKTYPPTQDIQDRACRFTYTLRPLREGKGAFPAVPAACFDPASGKYVTLQTEPIRIQIAPADRLAGGEIVGGSPADRPGRQLELQRKGIFANATDPGEVRDQSVRPAGWLAAVAGMAAVYALAALGTRRHRRLQADTAHQRRRGAVGRARRRLQEGTAKLKAQETVEGADEVKAAIVSLVADVADLPDGALTPREVCDRLRRLGVEEELVERIGRALESCDAARYAALPGGVNGLAQEADVLLEGMVRSLKRQRRL